MLRDRQKTSAFSNIQELKDTCHTAVYIEIESDSNELVWAEVEKLGDVINALSLIHISYVLKMLMAAGQWYPLTY